MRIKICGITRSEDALLAMKLGAWALGFIFWPKSSRYIEPARAGLILEELTAKGLRPQHAVGVFVNASMSEIDAARGLSGIDRIQLHGDESPEFCAQFERHLVWKALRLSGVEQLTLAQDYEAYVEALLFDAAVAGQYGGTGHTVDWSLFLHYHSSVPMILSGGLNPENIRLAAHTVPAYAFDLSSGVELQPGLKDSQKLQQLFIERG